MGRISIFERDVDALFGVGALFTARGFSYPTIKALVLAGIDAPMSSAWGVRPAEDMTSLDSCLLGTNTSPYL
jgi:hypothetical protein